MIVMLGIIYIVGKLIIEWLGNVQYRHSKEHKELMEYLKK